MKLVHRTLGSMPSAASTALLLAAMVTVFVAPPATAATRPLVLELFTSQGCSSCPPADALLGEVRLHGDVIALAYHVDYWDSLGWRDPFGFPGATQRQRAYVAALGTAGSFTPELVVDARASLVGSDRDTLSRILATGPAVSGATAVELHGTNDGIDIVLPDVTTAAGLRILALPFREQATTRVGHGENGGRELQEFHIVRAIQPLGRTQGGTQHLFYARAAWPAGATHVAVLLQQGDGGRLQGAAQVRLAP